MKFVDELNNSQRLKKESVPFPKCAVVTFRKVRRKANFAQVGFQCANKVIKLMLSHYRPPGFQEGEAPRIPDNRHMKMLKLSALRADSLYPQEIFLVLVSEYTFGQLYMFIY